ncbi:MAG TPA: hypothetical protein VH134_15790 [Candidatus Dormibacteraeota bacterium]|nr:hypothetical protein [Candidatus Dormibacteraeota bacterium]
MTADPLPDVPKDGDPADRRRHDLIDRLDWVIRRRLEELPDTLVAALLAAGIPCDRGSHPQALVERLRGDRPEFRAAS